ncbi:4-(cytidine 5'-diphospho)-2-C-methyl-D-erythritol kinase [Puniceicoccales bacterium CK1056]|uniref:4-diphosphocytidyl-2-C-methyl-D-erythritol kinase n=1 Tax=Oceanipulchritudo coccoides TaxID=2706888 RepID=A0A6B2LYE6_9BACT|nr:4-(cytidine 5'-diphospho)-2-C-methyl-D-erythritol kinase [Oceanipulchritudo coccoides]NDV61393.1 4-(cytidine 5'-diphospho)-2-C-methyl-D-erythritol kinase [Oceanipulchritudo coccoides]
MSSESRSVTIACPAKINLTLAILGLREDGFHDLHSVVAQTDYGDKLDLVWSGAGDPSKDRVVVEGALIPEEVNSVLAAIRLFRLKTGFHKGSITACLEKQIPVGAGLGGGSSNAAGALKALAKLFPDLFCELDLSELSSQIGSDCPLFLSDLPVLMEGRGERITPLADNLASRLRGKSVILFKPRFSINTAEAYRRLAAGKYYTSIGQAEAVYSDWKGSNSILPAPLNDFERLLGSWMPTLPLVLERLRSIHGIDARLSGSGSACFAFSEGDSSAKSRVIEEMQQAWGEVNWIEEIRLK